MPRKIVGTRWERLWSRVDRNGPVTVEALGPCWVWTGPVRDRFGYGAYSEGRGVLIAAHRVAWEVTNGPIPEGAVVMHRCDNPKCCNPSHLLVGTQADNMADMKTKRRSARGDGHTTRLHPERVARGERHGNSKVNADLVREIRRRAATESGPSIARSVGLNHTTVYRIIKGAAWAHVEGP